MKQMYSIFKILILSILITLSFSQVAISGDYNDDGMSDIAFYNPGSPWATLPILFSNGDGTWNAKNYSAPTWVHDPGAIAVPGSYGLCCIVPPPDDEPLPPFWGGGGGPMR